MNNGRFFIIMATAYLCVDTAAIGHDKVQPFPQPEAVTITEKSGVKFKPQLDIESGAPHIPPRTLRVYGRAEWYNDVWAIMYAWYFPKGFWDGTPWWRHDWSNAVVWIDNPAHEKPKVLGLSLSTSENKYGNTYVPAEGIENGTTPTLSRNVLPMRSAALGPAVNPGEFQDLVMWTQLTDAARAALNDQDNFGRTEVPISDDHFPKHLKKAWPF